MVAEVTPAAECKVDNERCEAREAVGEVQEVSCVVESPVGYLAASLVEATLAVAVAVVAGSSTVHAAAA